MKSPTKVVVLLVTLLGLLKYSRVVCADVLPKSVPLEEVLIAAVACHIDHPKVTPAMMASFIQSGFQNSTEEVKCLVNCAGKRMGALDENGQLKADFVQKKIPNSKELYERCRQEGMQENVCRRACKQLKCILKI